ncbi:MAG: serine hydrolase domain-containing protein, partial [Brevibacterium linens]
MIEPSPEHTAATPPAEQTVTPSAPADPASGIDRDNWQDPDNVRWSFQNVARVLPTTPISRGAGPVSELPADPQDLGEV